MTKLTDAKAAELRALCDKATPGPWEVQPIEEDGFEKGSAFIVAANLGGLVGAAHAWPTEIDSGDWSRVKANATLIAAARTAIPDLLDEREELIKERDRLKGLLDFQIEGESYAYFTAWKERDAALLREGQAIAARDELIDRYNKRVFEKELSPSDLRAAEKHCDWVSFKHAWNAVMNARAALNASKKETGE